MGIDDEISGAAWNSSLSNTLLVEEVEDLVFSSAEADDNNISSLNDTFYDSDYIPYEQRWETYVVPTIFAIIFIIGVLGNGTLILIFIKHRSMRSIPNMYICSLAIGDLLVTLFCVPFTSTVYTVESWPYGLLVCKFSEFIKDISIGVSVFTLTALSADRYFAIVDPMRVLQGRRATRITMLTIGGIWVFSIGIAIPSVLFSYIKIVEIGDKRILVCYPFPYEFSEIYPKIIVMSKFLIYYFVPLLFISSFYIVMARHLIISTRNIVGEAQGQGSQIQSRKKVAKMVLAFVVVFALCFFPTHLFLLWFYFDPDSDSKFNMIWHLVRIVGFCLSFTNSCINPITLFCVSTTFRKYFNEHLFCCCNKGNRGPRGRGTSISGTTRYNVSAATQCQSIYNHNRNGNSNSRRSPAGTSIASTTLTPGSRRNFSSTWDNSNSNLTNVESSAAQHSLAIPLTQLSSSSSSHKKPLLLKNKNKNSNSTLTQYEKTSTFIENPANRVEDEDEEEEEEEEEGE